MLRNRHVGAGGVECLGYSLTLKPWAGSSYDKHRRKAITTGCNPLATRAAQLLYIEKNVMPEWVIDLSNDLCVRLQRDLFLADVESQRSGLPPEALILTLNRIGTLKIQVFSNEHPPPHFRVACDEGQNDFRISDCIPLHGNKLDRFYRQIKDWHKMHKQDLIDAWNNTRPSDCPVGLYCK